MLSLNEGRLKVGIKTKTFRNVWLKKKNLKTKIKIHKFIDTKNIFKLFFIGIGFYTFPLLMFWLLKA